MVADGRQLGRRLARAVPGPPLADGRRRRGRRHRRPPPRRHGRDARGRDERVDRGAAAGAAAEPREPAARRPHAGADGCGRPPRRLLERAHARGLHRRRAGGGLGPADRPPGRPGRGLQAALAVAIVGTVLAERRPMWLDVVLVCAVLLAPSARGRTAQLVVVCTLPLVGFMALDRPSAHRGITIAAWAVALSAPSARSASSTAPVSSAWPATRARPGGRAGATSGTSPWPAGRPRRSPRSRPVPSGVGSAGDDRRAARPPRPTSARPPSTATSTWATAPASATPRSCGSPPTAGDFWRAGSLDTYDGRVWTRTVDADAAGATTADERGGIVRARRPSPSRTARSRPTPRSPAQPLTQHVEVLAGSFTTLVGAHPLSQLAAPSARSSRPTGPPPWRLRCGPATPTPS